VKPKSGRRKNTSQEIDKEIKTLCNEDRLRTSAQILALLKEKHPELKLLERTVRNRLISFGLFGRMASRKPLLREANKVKRLAFAKELEDWTPEDWAKVLWTDEKKFERFTSNSKRIKYVRRKIREPLRPDTSQPTVKHGGCSIMVWGCFMGGSVRDLYKVQGIMVKEQYHQILKIQPVY
jgi:hypothetical protein